ncbi:MAG: hypothetical protein HZC28_02100 [Spirochaetes bacterium]|nr:hypothetical protein [Spirochaetota bacterium]
MKKYTAFIPALIAALMAIACANADEQFTAKEMADALANQENGTTTEMTDMLGAMGSTDGGALSLAAPMATYTVTASGTMSGFANVSAGVYIKSNTTPITVTAPGFSGTISSVSVRVECYNASGSNINIVDTGKSLGDAANGTIKSIKYTRTVNATVKNIRRNIERSLSANTTFTAAGINDGTAGVTLTGTRIATNTVTGGEVTGTWTVSQTFNNVNAVRKSENGVVYTALTGIMNISVNGTYGGSRGSRNIDKDATVTFNATKTVSVTAGGTTVKVDIATGDITE